MTKVEMNIYFFVKDHIMHVSPTLVRLDLTYACGRLLQISIKKGLREQFFRQAIVFKKFDFNYSRKSEIEEDKKNIQSNQRYSLQQNRFHGL